MFYITAAPYTGASYNGHYMRKEQSWTERIAIFAKEMFKTNFQNILLYCNIAEEFKVSSQLNHNKNNTTKI